VEFKRRVVMKNILILLINLIHWFCWSYIDFFTILWYGTLPKVSTYHRVMRSGLYTRGIVHSDVNAQVLSVDDVPTRVKERIISHYIEELFDNEAFQANLLTVDIPIFDGKEVMGRGNVNQLLQDAKQKYLDADKTN
jgi:hypothetical protein